MANGPDVEREGRLAGKTAVVVGAGQTPGRTIGNGRATALRFAQEGAHVLLVDRDEESVAETQSMIVADKGRADTFTVDIASDSAGADIAEHAVSVLGRIDILHNNVGIGMGDNTPTKVSEDVWDRIFDVNLKAMWRTCKHVVPVMREQKSGSIICISSIAAVCAAGSITAYKVSKAGVNALVHSLAVTNAHHGIRVNGIMPGLMDTPMAVDAVSEALDIERDQLSEARDKMVPLNNRQGTAWDVANAALFLASDEARYITGASLPIDAGASVV